MMENLVKDREPTDEDIRAFLRSFKLPYPISTDAGAVASVRALLSDTNPRRPFTVRGPIPARLPRMSDLRQLDEHLRSADPELWRTKQVSDFLAGIWAQGYGPIYQAGLIWLLRIQRISQVLLVLLVVALALSLGGSGSVPTEVRTEPNPPEDEVRTEPEPSKGLTGLRAGIERSRGAPVAIPSHHAPIQSCRRVVEGISRQAQILRDARAQGRCEARSPAP